MHEWQKGFFSSYATFNEPKNGQTFCVIWSQLLDLLRPKIPPWSLIQFMKSTSKRLKRHDSIGNDTRNWRADVVVLFVNKLKL